jgi:hypothetical protein
MAVARDPLALAQDAHLAPELPGLAPERLALVQERCSLAQDPFALDSSYPIIRRSRSLSIGATRSCARAARPCAGPDRPCAGPDRPCAGPDRPCRDPLAPALARSSLPRPAGPGARLRQLRATRARPCARAENFVLDPPDLAQGSPAARRIGQLQPNPAPARLGSPAPSQDRWTSGQQRRGVARLRAILRRAADAEQGHPATAVVLPDPAHRAGS